MPTDSASPTHPDPRISDHLANERTFLAWIRTSISVIVFGFVVAKFGITLRQFLRLQGQGAEQSGVSLGIGVAFMAVGVLMALTALFRYRNTRARLELGEFRAAGPIILILGAVTAVFGAILAAYLIYTARTL
jgi:putative membrane protein